MINDTNEYVIKNQLDRKKVDGFQVKDRQRQIDIQLDRQIGGYMARQIDDKLYKWMNM